MSTCATASRALAEPLAGTAATARTWLLIEQPGPWGNKALTESNLDPELGRALDAAASAHGARVALIRRPGRNDCSEPAHRRVYLARTVPGDSWVRTALFPDSAALHALLELDFAALDAGGAGPPGPGWQPHEGDPLALVCTNGKRDRCCALLGRPLAAELTAAGGADVWEITHIGGHRFAPTLLVLPYGYAYGRLAAPAVQNVLAAVREGRVLTEGCRGRSAWGRPEQTADLAVREHTGETGADVLAVRGTTADPDAPRWTVTLEHRDGRRWQVALTETTEGPPLPATCGAAPAPPTRITVDHLTPLPAADAA